MTKARREQPGPPEPSSTGRRANVRGAAQHAAAETMIRRLVPGRIRISIAVYDQRGGRSFRGLPGYSRTVDVRSAEELRALWDSLAEFLDAGSFLEE